ncbi:MAG: hypothetical protein JXM71_02800, partial [Spirochaetales bacterium]|nr:hypothetical protein [Spirochaetales bacterium]
PYLKKDGASKFILDFSFIDLKKQVYRRVVQAARDGAVLPDTGRFNWKEGFWNPEEATTERRSHGDGRRAVDDGERAPLSKADAKPAQTVPRKGRVDRPGRGGPPWKVALAARKAAEENSTPSSARGKSGASSTRAPRKGAAGTRQSDRTSANKPAKKTTAPRAGRPRKPKPGSGH